MVVTGTEVEDLGSPSRPVSRLAARQDSKAQQGQQGGRALNRTSSTQEAQYWQDPSTSTPLPGSPTPSTPQGGTYRQPAQLQPPQQQSQPQYMGLSSLQQQQSPSLQSHPLQPAYRQNSGNAGELGGSAPLPRFKQRTSQDAGSRSSGEGRVNASTILNRTRGAPADAAKQLLASNGHTREVPEIQAC
jgi:hypothetical protein